MDLSWYALAILAACFVVASLFANSYFFLIGASLILFLTASSLSLVFSIAFGSHLLQPIAFLAVLAILMISLFIGFLKKRNLNWQNIGFALGASLLSVLIDFGVRKFGLASSAFTDGQTIVALAQGFQSGEFEPLTGTHAMKRGFGLPSMLALGPAGEYFAGLMPIFFLGALLTTWYLTRSLTSTKAQAVRVMAVISIVSLTTEAIARHALLVNTHAIAWFITAMGLNYIAVSRERALKNSEIVTIFGLCAAVGFLRLDYVILFAPITLALALVLANANRYLAMALVFTQGSSAAIWTSVAVKDFPIFRDFGPLFLLVGSLAVGVTISYAHKKGLRTDTLAKSFFTWLSLGVLVLVFINSDFTEAFHDLAINLFFGEGLWGASALFLLAAVALSGLFTRPLSGDLAKVFLNIFLISLALYLASKYLDGSSTGSGLPNLIRIGFGDSFNRTLVTWIPFLILPLTKLFSSFKAKK